MLFFNCYIKAKDKKKLLNFLSINTEEKDKDKTFELNVIGSLNIISQKINFKSISINNNDYNAPKEDLLYFKDAFERILKGKKFITIFNKKTMKEFIQEIS